MIIRLATPNDIPAISDMAERSQKVTGIPDPVHYPPSEVVKQLFRKSILERYVAEDEGIIVGHGMIQQPTDENVPYWINGIGAVGSVAIMEHGGAFVDPDRMGEGIWTGLLERRLEVVKSLGSIPVSATWRKNLHVKRSFESHGGRYVGEQSLGGGVSLYVFD